MFTPISEIKKLTIHELRDAIDEISNQVLHLERSQVELQEFIDSTDDSDDKVEFQCAIDENVSILMDKKKRIRVLKERLRLVDPAYFIEHYGDSEAAEDLKPEESAPAPIAISVEEEKVADQGLYL